jgi:tetratricopeptide (TPR) repeat protein
MGGAGKTQLALDYCRRNKDLGTFRAIFWLDASSRNALYRSMEAVAKRLLPGRIFSSPDDAVDLVREILSGWSDAWLLVFDNLDNPSDLNHIVTFLPDSHCGVILVTSRCAGSKDLGRVIPLDGMKRDEGIELLPQFSQEDAREIAAAEQILTMMGYLPLAIDQARAYISRRKLRLTDFVDEYERRKKAVMKETPTLWQYRRAFQDQEEATSLSLFTTWEMSLSLLVEDQKTKLQDVFTLFAFFHPFSISERLFSEPKWSADLQTSPMFTFKETGRWSHLDFESAIIQMQEQSLIQFSPRDSNEIVMSLHPMVSEWLRMRLNSKSLSTFHATAVSHLGGYLDYLDSTHESDHMERQEALSHVDRICKMEEFCSESNGYCQASFHFGVFYAAHGRFEDAARMYDHALGGFEKAWGPDHTSTLDTINNLGNLYSDQGQFGDAERMYNCALAGFEKAWGPEHTSTLDTVNNLGNLYLDQGRFDDAERMYNRALAGFEKAWGPEHTSTLNTINNLGILYKVQGRLNDAERMYNCALAGKEKAWGPEHTSTLDTVNNLGALYKDQGQFDKAERMYNRALAGFEKAWGPEHTSTLAAVNNLGNLYKDQGQFDDAGRVYNRALAGFEKAWGPEHTSTLETVNNLGNLYLDQGRFDDAERMYNHALAGKEKAWGREHTSTLETVNNLGILYKVQGRFDDAERMFNRALAGKEKAWGPEHTSTLRTVNNLGVLSKDQGRFEDAQKMFDRVSAGKYYSSEATITK